MLNVKQQWQDKLYRNWLRGSLGLKYLKEGIEYVVDSSVKDLHNDMIQAVVAAPGVTNLQCGVCTLNNLLPDHAGGRCKQNTRGLCFCNKPAGRRKCPNQICSVFYDLIIDSHNLRDPSWKNSDPSLWVSDHWQVAKCFMSPSGVAGRGSARDTDVSGLLNVAINTKNVTSQFSCGLNLLKQMRDTRNLILHSSSLTLQDTEVSNYIDQMMQLLLDPRKLVLDIGAQNSVRHLQRLKNSTCFISSKNEKEIRKKALQAIKESKENALENIKEAEIKAIDKIESSTLESKTISEIKANQSANETKLIVLEDTIGNIFKRQADTSQLVENMTKRQGHSEEMEPEFRRMENQNEQKKDMTQCLLRTYKKFYTGVDFSPVLPGKEVDVDEIYVPLNMMTVSGDVNQYYCRYYNVRDSPREVSTNMNLEDMTLCMKSVFILAKSGMGKTTFCRHLISEWCKQQSTEPRKYSAQCLNRISFLFFVSLKHVNTETSIEQMIKAQLFDTEFHDLVDHVLLKEPQNCLVILDGLDEWTAPENIQKSPVITPGLPLKEIKSGYATVYTTRPWKYESIKPRDCEVDIIAEIKGINLECSTRLAELAFKQLKKVSNIKASAEEFIQDLRFRDLSRLQHIPLLLILLACLWYDKHKFDSSLSGIYCAIIEWLLFHAERRRGIQLHGASMKSQTDRGNVPSCFTDKFRCRKNFNSLLVPLGKFSFLTLFNRQLYKFRRLVFKNEEFQSFGLDNDCINTLLDTGLLTEQAVVGKAAVVSYKSFAFIHETFHEFFAALYIATASQVRQLSDYMLSAERHLDMSQVYQFLSGMNGKCMASLSKEIGTSVDKNENNKLYRRGASTYTGLVTEMNRMILSCLRETMNCDNQIVRMVLRDIYIGDETRILLPFLTETDVREVVSLYCDSTITDDDVRSHLENISNLELFVCKDSLADLYTVLKNCAHVIKCLALSEADLTRTATFSQLSFVQLTSLTMCKVKATRAQICRIYLCSRRLKSVNLDSCMFIEESLCESYTSSDYFASVERLNIADCIGLPINKIPQPMLKELEFTKGACFYCADLIQTCPCLRHISIVEVNLGKTFLPNLFSPKKLIYLESVHFRKVKMCCSNLYFHLEALLKIPKLRAVDIDQIYLTNESPETVHDWIKNLRINVQSGENSSLRRFVTKSYEARNAPLASRLSISLETEYLTFE